MFRKALLVLCLIFIPLAANAQVKNLVLNPSFEQDEVIQDDPAWQAWATWGAENGLNSKVAIDEKESIDEKRSLRIEPKGVENWHFMVLNLPIDVSKGKKYTASFWAKSEKDRPITAKLKATDNSIDFCLTDLGFITTEWSKFEFICVPLINQIKFEIWCAKSEVPFWLDFVALYEGEPVADFLPSKLKSQKSVEHTNKLATTWAKLKLSRSGS